LGFKFVIKIKIKPGRNCLFWIIWDSNHLLSRPLINIF